MSYYVLEGHWRGGAVRFKVKRYQPYCEADEVIRDFRAHPPSETWGPVPEKDHQVRARAQAFADALNHGGRAAERALRRVQC